MKYSILLSVIFIGFIVYAGIQIPTGVTGKTEKNGTGCNCHNFERDQSVMVQIEGPDKLFKGETGQYELFLSGGPAVAGGFNVASYLGNLSPVDGTAQLLLSELTHTSPKTFGGAQTISWQFTFTALDSVYTDTIYSASNSVNGDGIATSADRWNFGAKFAILVIDEPSSTGNEDIIANTFKLEQNYPNPFNPGTVINWQSVSGSYTTLRVFDILGNEITVLIDEYKPAGNYSVAFNAADLPSGIYLYTLTTDNFTQTKKMILLR